MLFFVAQLYADTPLLAWANDADVAADDLRKAAERLQKTAERIGASGRAKDQAALESDAAELARRARLLDALVKKQTGE